jgi:OPA family glycerol-3-phosphate transporter-like MFS transporter
MSDARLRTWQRITLVTLFTGYAGYYVCRSNLSVATPLILKEFQGTGIDEEAIGGVVSFGVLLYAIGKIFNGVLADRVGGRPLFLLGMFASILCTLLFGLSSGLTAFLVFWACNRFFQSMGWVSLVKSASRWFPYSRHATIMGILSMSFLLGDAGVRLYLGGLLHLGFGWRALFYTAAATLGVIGVISFFTLKSSPADVGAVEPTANPINVYDDAADQQSTMWELLAPLLASKTFWLICIVNFGLTLIRETFTFWTPTFLHKEVGMAPENAALGSLLFPLTGAAAALSAGILSDRLGGRHGRIIVPSMVLLIASLGLLIVIPVAGHPVRAVMLISLVAFFLLAPYSFLSGVMALDLGGKHGSSTAAGFVDAAGYSGAIFSGYGIAKIAKEYSWQAAFGFLAICAALTTVAAVAYWRHHEYTLRNFARQHGESAGE